VNAAREVNATSAVPPSKRKSRKRKPTATSPESVAPAEAKPELSPRDAYKDVMIFENREAAMEAFCRCFCLIRTLGKVVRIDDFETFDPHTFVTLQYSNWKYKVIDEESKETKLESVAWVWLHGPERNAKDKMTYQPGAGRYCDKGTTLNRWKGLGSKPVPGDISLWNELLDFMFPDPEARKYFEQWLAYALQHLGAKLMTAIVLYSEVEGIGKNSVAEAVAAIYGVNAVTITKKQLDADFNSWQPDRQFVVGDEIHGGGDKRGVLEKVKLLITSRTVEVNKKHERQFEIPNKANFLFLTNNFDAFHVRNADRRFWIWEIPQTAALPDEFYERFHAWKDSPEGIAALHDHLLHVDLTGFNPNAKAPMTKAKEEAIELSRSEEERWLLELLGGRPKATLWTLEDLVTLFQHENPRSRAGRAAMQTALKRLGFKKAHGGRQVRVGSGQFYLWVIAQTEEAERLLAIREPSELAKMYTSNSQTEARQPIPEE